MAVCMLWLLTYVGQGLDLAVGNRPVIIVQGTQGQDYRHGNSIRKKSELNSVGSNLLHLRIYPSEASYQDDLSGNWLLFNDESRTSSWSPTSILIDDIIKEPKEFQTVFFALSPTVLNVLYSEYVTSLSHAAEPFVYDETNLVSHHQRTKKKWIDCKHSKSVISLPILVCDETGKQTLQESRQSNYDDLFEQKLNTATSLKTDLTYGRSEPSREFQDGEFVSRAFVYETSKLPGKRNQVFVGRRSTDQGESVAQQHQSQVSATSSPPGTASIASQLMLRSTRGSIQYDVPQIECPVSSDGMERFACPNPDRIGRYHCIDDNVLCDGFIDCPTGEDEDRHACMFYKTTKAHLDVLADAILRWARGR